MPSYQALENVVIPFLCIAPRPTRISIASGKPPSPLPPRSSKSIHTPSFVANSRFSSDRLYQLHLPTSHNTESSPQSRTLPTHPLHPFPTSQCIKPPQFSTPAAASAATTRPPAPVRGSLLPAHLKMTSAANANLISKPWIRCVRRIW